MKPTLICLSACLLIVAFFAQPSLQSDCKKKREAALKLVEQQSRNQNLGLAIVVPNCNDDGTYKTLQCHHNSNFCQCWDKDGLPLTQPKKNLGKCACLVDRAKALKSIPPSQTDIPDITSCENDGSYTAKQCNREACWCVKPDTGAKLTSDYRNKSALKC